VEGRRVEDRYGHPKLGLVWPCSGWGLLLTFLLSPLAGRRGDRLARSGRHLYTVAA
jgi:hypothetical protein